MYTVVAREQTANRRRAITASVIVFGLTTVLATTLVRSRHAVHLGSRIAPTDWPISFQPPMDWREVNREEDSIEFRDLRNPRNPKQFAVYLVPKPPDLSATELAVGVMSLHLPRSLAGGGIAPPENAELGSLPGAKVDMPATGDYVHIGLPSSDETKAIILRYHTLLPFTERDVQACRRIVESVKP